MFNEDFKCVPPQTRRDARETALQILYALELSQYSVSAVFQDLMPKCASPPPTVSFAQKIVEQTFEGRDEFDGFIRQFSANWTFERIAVLDLIIMRVAICEFLHFRDIPPKVSIDEAIELAKRFSTYKSTGFINGILDAVLLDLEKKKMVVKSGRGRMDKHQTRQKKK